MSDEMEYTNCCSQELAELCALSTSGELSKEEWAILNQHVASCANCAALLNEYSSLTRVGMAKLAADREQETEIPFGYNEARAEDRFAAALHAARPTRHTRPRSHTHFEQVPAGPLRLKRPLILIGTAAVLLLSIGGAFQLGRKVTSSPVHPIATVVAPPVVVADAEKTRLKTELASAQASLQSVTTKSTDLNKQLAELAETRASLLTQIADLTHKDAADTTTLASLTQQRDSLEQQLNDTSAALMRAKEDLIRAQQDRQGALFRVANLEVEVNDLHAELASTNSSATSDEKYLAADRDIRELMGARQLYIADVFDVQNNGERSKPFGRVFYTKGKSLIFYAFDLQAQPGFRETKAFQAWGKPDNASARPISLGIFYEDSEQNQRWVVKSDNPNVLAQINAVFVTVEPHGGSQKPTSKPFLEAYLHSLPPNHP